MLVKKVLCHIHISLWLTAPRKYQSVSWKGHAARSTCLTNIIIEDSEARERETQIAEGEHQSKMKPDCPKMASINYQVNSSENHPESLHPVALTDSSSQSYREQTRPRIIITRSSRCWRQHLGNGADEISTVSRNYAKACAVLSSDCPTVDRGGSWTIKNY